MSYQQKVRGIILARRNYGESDRRLRLFSRELGLVTVIAKGVRKIPSRRGGLVEPLQPVIIFLSGKEFKYLNKIEQLEYRIGSNESFERVARLILENLTENEQQIELYDRFEAWLIKQDQDTSRLMLGEVMISLMVLEKSGLAPDWSSWQGEARIGKAIRWMAKNPANGLRLAVSETEARKILRAVRNQALLV